MTHPCSTPTDRGWRVLALALLAAGCIGSSAALCADDFAEARRRMVETIRDMAAQMPAAQGRERLAPRVLAALDRVPRHEFVAPALRAEAYQNRPLPIGHGQTISQPYIVALMTDLLGVGEGDVVLEVGTGSGYQAAVLAELVRAVYSIEIIEPLAVEARARLARLGYRNVTVRHGDGYYGWQAHAPFDGIVVTAAAGHIPPPLVRQLKPGGRMVIPVGEQFMVQQLVLVEKDAAGKITARQLLPVRFVPLTGEH
jgi:protein-L-isoaspartate(D-aspartate) O-methyltransferase